MKNQELTLLYIFDAIMTEGSIARASERLSMAQPPVPWVLPALQPGNAWQRKHCNAS